MKYAVYSRVVSIERRSKNVYDHGIGESAVFVPHDLGFYMLLERSHEALHIGYEEPKFKPGDRIKITFEKVEE